MNHPTRSGAFTRRRFIALTGTAVLAGVVGVPPAHADQKLLDEAMAKVLAGRTAGDGSDVIKLELPEIAENGNTVPLRFEVDSPMTDANHVAHVHVFADGNPRPDVASFHFTPASGKAAASTRMRLAKTQNIVAVAEMSDGKVVMAKKEVKVTIGGCGG